MNKPILMPQLSATRARTGMRSLSELIALLLKQYELQDQLRSRQQAASAVRPQAASAVRPQAASAVRPQRSNGVSGTAGATGIANATGTAGATGTGCATGEFSNSRTREGQTKPVQATFAWFDAASTEPAGV